MINLTKQEETTKNGFLLSMIYVLLIRLLNSSTFHHICNAMDMVDDVCKLFTIN